MFCPKDGTKLEFGSKPAEEGEDPFLAMRSAAAETLPSLFGEEEDESEEETQAADMARTEGAGEAFPEEMAQADRLIGTTIDRHYEIMQRLGSGGMSIVYLAKDIRLKKIVALKMMLPHLVANPMSLQRFQQEAEAASNLSHANVVGVHNFGVTKSNQPYLVMDYCHGISLASMISAQGRLEMDRAVPIFVQIAGALAHAHEKGVIHRDLKPSNILLTESGDLHDVVKIVDFGIAKILPQEGREAAQLTQTGEVFGSPLYMSPEQCRGEKLDARSDVYSMGCLMYETLVGEPPLNGANMLEILFKHINEMPATLSQAVEGVQFPPGLEKIVFRALAKEPSERFQSMAALREDLIRFQGGKRVNIIDLLSTMEVFWHKRRVWKRSEKIAVGISVVLLVTAIGLGVQLTALYANAATSPFQKATVEWKENSGTQLPKLPPDPTQVRDNIEKTQRLLELVKNEPPDDAQEEVQNELTRLQSIADEWAAAALWEQAAEVLKKAVEINRDYKVNDPSSAPSRKLIQSLADCYLESKQYKQAREQYQQLIEMDQDSKQFGTVLATAYARLGDSLYFQHEWQKALEAYADALKDWSSESDIVNGGKYVPNWFSAIRDKPTLLALSRLADCERNLASTNNALYLKATFAYHQAAISWKLKENEDAQNYAVALYYFAQMSSHVETSELQDMQKNDSEEFARNPEKRYTTSDLYKLSLATIKKSPGEKPYLLAGILKGYSDYLFTKFDLGEAIKTRFESLRLLSK
jgi:tRNA A-37 threonylcarbamoyl transferase component Bud32/tetratricopeptide (TPR) repeat protein